jgi:phenylacetate-CoA ligase
MLELTREGRMDELTILAEARSEHWDGSGLTGHAERISAHIKNTIGITADVRVVAPDTLERSAGKARRVRDRRPRE